MYTMRVCAARAARMHACVYVTVLCEHAGTLCQLCMHVYAHVYTHMHADHGLIGEPISTRSGDIHGDDGVKATWEEEAY